MSVVEIFGNLQGRNKWASPVVGPDGVIYGIPSSATSVLAVDPVQRTVQTFGNLPQGGSKWMGAVVGPDGVIYGIPFCATSVLGVGTYQSWSKELYRFFPLETRRIVVHALHCLQELGPIAADRILPLAITPARVIPFTAEEWVAHHDDDDDEAG